MIYVILGLSILYLVEIILHEIDRKKLKEYEKKFRGD